MNRVMNKQNEVLLCFTNGGYRSLDHSISTLMVRLPDKGQTNEARAGHYLEECTGLRIALFTTGTSLLRAWRGSDAVLQSGGVAFFRKFGFLHLRNELERNHLGRK